jgi:hypothetical protein
MREPGRFALGEFRPSCPQGIPPTLGGGAAGDPDDPEERPLPVALLPNHLCQHRLKRCDAEQRDA